MLDGLILWSSSIVDQRRSESVNVTLIRRHQDLSLVVLATPHNRHLSSIINYIKWVEPLLVKF